MTFSARTGKHPSIIENELFARAQALLDERAAVVENRAPNTSDYLLTGMLRCRACGGAYFGAGTKGRNGFYRYYACRNRLTKGTHTVVGVSEWQQRTWSPP
ncbi:MAG: recombinase zinc ribbon domain-containing protein [Acidimicrobiales bacterium]